METDTTPTKKRSRREEQSHFNNLIAISMALLAAFMGVTKVKDDNIVQAMLQAKSDAVDTWGEYQSKRIKHHLVEIGRNQTMALRLSVTGPAAEQLDRQVQSYEGEIARYQKEEPVLQQKAKALEALYDTLNFKDDQFDLSDVMLSISMAMLAVTALTRKQWLLWMAWVFAAFGVVMGLAGLLGLRLHPDWIIKLLS